MNIFDFDKDHRLENDVALLRPLAASDDAHLVKFALEEPDLWKYSMIAVKGKEGLKNYIHRALQGRRAHRDYPFIVFDKRSDSYAGSTRFYDIQFINSSLQVGYTWYGKQFQGTGLNKHCKFLLLEFAFETMKIERVEFRADSLNARSIAAMKSIGCTVEGILRSHGPRQDGSRRDSIILSILKSEWEAGLKQRLSLKLPAAAS
ncbi:RimJ/RimL family protein N-acetyltransferase [Anseongella ginsenosidimutans]|uniref:RimJ/RimL family protein N-acetyltransferase n=1 Tax=Anseongella ginsenosidimutans TaxID=496056 RepID=A0A4R3KRA2_9SPHI|nr:GNAT family N-acetyltransferase [Anseongella ginsenosidimutans]QEC52871.1 GNAT family N-acetyltransferase [Anseongella ginsenosidimutans]TCS87261.1 RimJ/RimL family protein N-acetyltransferase [Anseongella ginsenosidimutans]